MSSENGISAKCQNCFAAMTTSLAELEKDGCVVCPICLKVNVFDVEKYKRQKQALMKKMLGNRPLKPENN